MDRLISEQAVIDAIDKWAKNMGVLIALPANEVTPLFDSIHELPSVNPQEPNIKSLGEDLRIFRNSITDDKVLIGFNMAVAICNKYFAGSEGQE